MLSILFGLAAAAIGVLWFVLWGGWDEFLVVLQGSCPAILVLVGLVAVAAGISSIKEKIAEKKEEKKEKAQPEEKKE